MLQNRVMAHIVVRVLITALGLYMAAALIPGIEADSPGAFIWAAIALGIVNTLVRPLIVLLTLPVSVVTLGGFLLVINAAMLKLADWFVDGLHVQGFLSALFGALIISVINWAVNSFVRSKEDR